MSKKSH